MRIIKKLVRYFIKELSLVRDPAVEDAVVAVYKSASGIVEDDPDINEYLDTLSPEEDVISESHFVYEDVVKSSKYDGKLFSYLLVKDKLDTQGEYISSSAIKEAVEYISELSFKGGFKIGVEHTDFDHGYVKYAKVYYDDDGSLARAFGFKEDKIIPGSAIAEIQLTNKGIDFYNTGRIKGISAGGKAYKQFEKSVEKTEKSSIDDTGFFKALKNFFSRNKEDIIMSKDDVKEVIKDVLKEEDSLKNTSNVTEASKLDKIISEVNKLNVLMTSFKSTDTNVVNNDNIVVVEDGCNEEPKHEVDIEVINTIKSASDRNSSDIEKLTTALGSMKETLDKLCEVKGLSNAEEIKHTTKSMPVENGVKKDFHYKTNYRRS